jgi:iron-sulfur cluster assembly protein
MPEITTELSELTITEKALSEVRKILEENKLDAKEYFLRIGVKGGGCSGFVYSLAFDNKLREDDHIIYSQDFRVVVDPKSLFYLHGTVLDFSDGLMGRGFVFNNPNATKTCGCGSSFAV